MATKYLDHGAYGAYSATPTWGNAQDGDGTLQAIGTPSTAEIVFTGIPSTGSIYVLGVVVTATWATSADNCANLLATAINALTTTALGPASFTTKSQVRNHLYARGPANGAPSGTCQVMTRQASASHAGLVAFTHTLNNVSSAATVNFSGGTGGCWGWITNTATIWASAVAITGYGIWQAAPFTGSIAAGDVVNVRSGKTISFSGNTGYTLAIPNMGTITSPVLFVIDDSTLWSDGAGPVIRVYHTPGGNGYSLAFTPNASASIHIKAPLYSSGVRGLSFEFISTTGLSGSCYVTIAPNVLFENITFACTGTRAQSQGVISAGGASVSMTGNQLTRFKGCKFVWPGQQAAIINMGNGGYNYRAEFVGCEFSATDAATASTSIVAIHNNNYHRLTLDSCKFSGFVSGSRLIAASTTLTGDDALFVRNCDMGGVTVLGPNLMSSVVGEFDAGMRGFFMTTQYGTRDFVYERAGRLYVEWLASKGRPTLNARLHDGTTPWSIFAVPSNTANALGPVSPSELPRIAKIILPDADLTEGVRTAKINFLLDSNLAWTKKDISVLFEYQMPDGTVQTYDTYDADGSALSSSSASWSATAWNSQTWVPKEFSITTPTAVKAGSEVSVYMRIHTTSTNETWGVILDPEVLIT